MNKDSNRLKQTNDPNFLLHRYIETSDSFRFLKVTREIHRQSTFITDEYLPKGLDFFDIKRSEITTPPTTSNSTHFIFHSAYCCSTMLTRAFDIEQKSMGLKEPVILNDIVGWRRRGANKKLLKAVLKQSLVHLSKPFSLDEVTIIKPSNTCNILASDILELFPKANALLLYAPIKSFLQSIAKKEMWGRIWVRKALVGTMKDHMLVGGYNIEDILQLTDLQVAALGWLSQYELFTNIIKTYGTSRIKLLNSDTFLSHQLESITTLSEHYGIKMTETHINEVLSGPAFTQHSKHGHDFDAKARSLEQEKVSALHNSEINMISEWIIEVAKSQSIKLNTTDANLLH